jgi:hypothetical protein
MFLSTVVLTRELSYSSSWYLTMRKEECYFPILYGWGNCGSEPSPPCPQDPESEALLQIILPQVPTLTQGQTQHSPPQPYLPTMAGACSVLEPLTLAHSGLLLVWCPLQGRGWQPC